MPPIYHVTSAVRFSNRIWSFLIRHGVAPKSMQLLTVPGRKTGKPYTNVVALVARDGQQYLVAPYGEVNWLRNARAVGQVSLRHGQQQWAARLQELAPSQSGPVLKKYLAEHPITRPYFDVGSDAPVEAFEQEASRHPVFLLHQV